METIQLLDPKTSIGKTVYVVMETYVSPDTDEETYCSAVCATKKSAQEKIQKCKEYIAEHWGDAFGYKPDDVSSRAKPDPFNEGSLDEDDDWVVEMSTPEHYIIHDSYYDHYYEAWITPHQLS